jgi:hypothetical protein
MQWAINSFCGFKDQKKSTVMKKTERNAPKKETFRMNYCTSCNCVWETDRSSPQYIRKYRDFPKRGIGKKICKYC